MTAMHQLPQVTLRMAETGVRRLWVVAGEASWTREQLREITHQLPGDWLWIGLEPELPLSCAPKACRTLLGREFLHAVFDARCGLNTEALAIVSGTLKAGSWLVMLTPPWLAWRNLPDVDSCRWSDSSHPIATPCFIDSLQSCVTADCETVLWQQHHPLSFAQFKPRPACQSVSGAATQQQAEILTTLQAMPPGVAVVTAPRGRGKSALAGMLLNRLPVKAYVTAPAKVATDVLAQYAGERFHFIAPDLLLASKQHYLADWLIIDEAAALPAPQLHQLISHFPRVLLTTTVQGYEGCGRGFLLKFCASIANLTRFNLNMPLRWAPCDALEQIIDKVVLLEQPEPLIAAQGEVLLEIVERDHHEKSLAQLKQIYHLLSSAHYRTSPLDWRRMLDAPGQHFIRVTCQHQTIGALWLVEEGGLDAKLSTAIWAGLRRPRGNLVAQSLAAHGGSPLAATLRGMRISRIAVHPERQRQQIGKHLVEMAQRSAPTSLDYLSVSFGYSDELWRFWESCGFVLVRVGSHRDASSGCYNAMALIPLSRQGKELANHEHQRLRRDIGFLQPWIDQTLPVNPLPETALNDDDWQELAGFAFGHRPLEVCLGSLNRLLLVSYQHLPALRGWVVEHRERSQLCQQLALTGHKALVASIRKEVERALNGLNKGVTLKTMFRKLLD